MLVGVYVKGGYFFLSLIEPLKELGSTCLPFCEIVIIPLWASLRAAHLVRSICGCQSSSAKTRRAASLGQMVEDLLRLARSERIASSIFASI